MLGSLAWLLSVIRLGLWRVVVLRGLFVKRVVSLDSWPPGCALLDTWFVLGLSGIRPAVMYKTA